jgi:hypothetical protein
MAAEDVGGVRKSIRLAREFDLNGMEQGWSEQLDKLGRYAVEPA